MSNLVKPIHIEALCLGNVRFFAPPSSKPEFPWVAVEDLHAAMALPRAFRRYLKNTLQSSEWHRETCTVATADGLVEIMPHFMAQGMISAMTEVGRCPSDFHYQYCRAGAFAANKMMEGLSPDEVTAYLHAAWVSVGGRPNEGGAE